MASDNCGQGDALASRRPRSPAFALVVGFISALLTSAGLAMSAAAQPVALRVGHFANVTHVQGLIGHHLTRAGKGWFEQRLGNDVKIEWFVYNAGPGAMEAIFAGSLDLTYVGPNPALNAYARSRGEEIRVLAGAVNGGAALVVQAGSTLATPADFRGRKIATPQLGNTQDVAARAWLVAGGLRITQTGGDAQVLPAANADQLALFRSKQVDAVWTVEPWVTRLETEAGGRVLLEQRDAITTLLVSGVKALATRRNLVAKFVAAHVELTDWIKANPAEAQQMVRDELGAEMRTTIPQVQVERGWQRIDITSAVSLDDLRTFVASAQSVGFLRGAPDLSRLVEKP